MAKRRVVLTGAAGYIAQRMFAELNERWEVVPIDVRATTRDGKSVSLDDVRPLVDEIVAAKVAAIPLPRDGKDVEPEAVRAMLVEAVDALPGGHREDKR